MSNFIHSRSSVKALQTITRKHAQTFALLLLVRITDMYTKDYNIKICIFIVFLLVTIANYTISFPFKSYINEIG